MHKLKRLVKERVRFLEEQSGITDFRAATECLNEAMNEADWDLLEQLNLELELHPLDQTSGFEVLMNWIIDEPCLPDQDEAILRMAYKERKKASQISEALEKLSKEIANVFPELSNPYSLLRVIRPWKHAMEPFVLGPPPKSTKGQSSSDGPHEDEAVEPPMGASEKQRYFDQGIYSPRTLLYELTGDWGHIERTVQSKGCFGLEVPVVGPDGVLIEIQRYVQRQIDLSEPIQTQRKYPPWCKPAVRDLWEKINKSPYYNAGFLADSTKHRVIEYTIYSYADYHGLERPSEDWGPKQIQRAIDNTQSV